MSGVLSVDDFLNLAAAEMALASPAMWKGATLGFIFALNAMYAYATIAETKIARPVQLRADCVRAIKWRGSVSGFGLGWRRDEAAAHAEAVLDEYTRDEDYADLAPGARDGHREC